MTHRTVTIMFSGELELDEDSIWPDKDAPENWTADDVKAVMEACGSKQRVIDDWNLIDNLRVEVMSDSIKYSAGTDTVMDLSEVW
jgi:hypothetical protein